MQESEINFVEPASQTRRTRASRSREERPWGSYEVLTRGPGFQVKRLTVKPESRLSYQWHRHRAETWTVARGIATVTLDGEQQNLGPSQSIHVPRTVKHRIANPVKRRAARDNRSANRRLPRRGRHSARGGRLRPERGLGFVSLRIA